VSCAIAAVDAKSDADNDRAVAARGRNFMTNSDMRLEITFEQIQVINQ
jgi:hypothetical protein